MGKETLKITPVRTLSAVCILGFFILSGLQINDLINDQENVYYCESTLEASLCSFGLSSGLHTRCYRTQEEKDNWRTAPYCEIGWTKFDKVVESNDVVYVVPVKVSNNEWYTRAGGKCFLYGNLQKEVTCDE